MISRGMILQDWAVANNSIGYPCIGFLLLQTFSLSLSLLPGITSPNEVTALALCFRFLSLKKRDPIVCFYDI